MSILRPILPLFRSTKDKINSLLGAKELIEQFPKGNIEERS